jgi:hypothetical protein
MAAIFRLKQLSSKPEIKPYEWKPKKDHEKPENP